MSNLKKLIALFGLGFGFGLVIMLTNSKPNAVELEKIRRAAYDFAVQCSHTKEPQLKFEDIQWVIVPGSQLIFRETSALETVRGAYNPADSTIYIPSEFVSSRVIIAHEIMHAIGYSTHDSVPFRTCNLMPDQHPELTR